MEHLSFEGVLVVLFTEGGFRKGFRGIHDRVLEDLLLVRKKL